MARFLCLLLLTFAVNVNALVKFDFIGEFFCHHPQFRYHLTLFEDDWLYDNAISHMAPVVSNYPHYYRALGEDDNDGCVLGWCEYTFEIYLVIIHSCTFNGKYKKLTVDLGSHYKREGTVKIIHNINVTDAGEWTIDVIGKKKFKPEKQKPILIVN